MARNIPLGWTKHLKTQEEKDNFEQYLRNSTLLVDRLYQIVKEKLELLEREELSTASYESPSWAYRQAHINGAKTELKNLLDLFNFMRN